MVRRTVGVRALKLCGVVHQLPVSWRGTRRHVAPFHVAHPLGEGLTHLTSMVDETTW